MLRTIKMTLRLPGELHRELEKRAKATRQSLNAVIIDVIRHGLAQPLADESEHDRLVRALQANGLYEPLGPEWDGYVLAAPDMTPSQMRESLKGVPALSAIIVEDRGPR